MVGAFLRDWLGIVGLGTAMLAYAGARDPDVFPFYVDAHLVNVALLVSTGPAVAILLLRIFRPALLGWPVQSLRLGSMFKARVYTHDGR